MVATGFDEEAFSGRLRRRIGGSLHQVAYSRTQQPSVVRRSPHCLVRWSCASSSLASPVGLICSTSFAPQSKRWPGGEAWEEYTSSHDGGGS